MGERSGSPLAQVMACCLTAPSHYLNQCWLIISKVEWYSSKGKFTRDTLAINYWNYLEIKYLKYHSNFPGANELRKVINSMHLNLNPWLPHLQPNSLHPHIQPPTLAALSMCIEHSGMTEYNEITTCSKGLGNRWPRLKSRTQSWISLKMKHIIALISSKHGLGYSWQGSLITKWSIVV